MDSSSLFILDCKKQQLGMRTQSNRFARMSGVVNLKHSLVVCGGYEDWNFGGYKVTTKVEEFDEHTPIPNTLPSMVK